MNRTSSEPTPHHEKVMEVMDDGGSLRRMSSRTARSLTIEDPALLRATPVGQVLRSCGRLLAKSDGDAETFKLSSQVQSIDAFISHNWSTPRIQKWMVLATHFNLRLASTVSVVVMLILAALTAVGAMPCVKINAGMILKETGCVSIFGGAIAYGVMLFFGRGLTSRLGLSDSWHVFLDKTCIHQTDAELKEKGIKSLAAQLNNSKTMVVVYADTYLRKVWTVYELASALILWPNVRVVVLPLYLPKLVIAGIVLGPVRFGALLIFKTDLSGDVGEFLTHWGFEFVLLPIYLVAAVILRNWGKERGAIRHAVKRFDIRTAACFHESDRQLVQGNIIEFMKDFNFVSHSASNDEALTAFNDLVHRKVPGALVASLGRTGVPCVFLCPLIISSLGRALDASTAMIYHKAPICPTVSKCLLVMTLYSSIIPNSIAIMSSMLGKLRRLGGFAEKLYMASSVVLAAAATLGAKEVLMPFSKHTCRSAWHAFGLSLGIILSHVVTYLLYRPIESQFNTPCWAPSCCGSLSCDAKLRERCCCLHHEGVEDSESASEPGRVGHHDSSTTEESDREDDETEEVGNSDAVLSC